MLDVDPVGCRREVPFAQAHRCVRRHRAAASVVVDEAPE
jgi:hypothetical protein